MQLPDFCVVSIRHRGIIPVMNNEYLGFGIWWSHHPFHVRHLASNFHSKSHDNSLYTLLIRALASSTTNGVHARISPDVEWVPMGHSTREVGFISQCRKKV